MPVTIEAIRAVRAVVERSIVEVKAALDATGGDVDAAIDRLITPLERAANRWAGMLANTRNAQLDDPPRAPLRPAANELDLARVLADFDAAVRTKRFWVGEPNPAALAALGDRLPASYAQFLERFNGVDDGVCARLWPAEHRPDVLGDYSEPELEDGFPIGEHDDLGYLFLRLEQAAAPVYFYDYSDPPPVLPIACNFQSFLRDWIDVDLNLLEVIENARRRSNP